MENGYKKDIIETKNVMQCIMFQVKKCLSSSKRTFGIVMKYVEFYILIYLLAKGKIDMSLCLLILVGIKDMAILSALGIIEWDKIQTKIKVGNE